MRGRLVSRRSPDRTSNWWSSNCCDSSIPLSPVWVCLLCAARLVSFSPPCCCHGFLTFLLLLEMKKRSSLYAPLEPKSVAAHRQPKPIRQLNSQMLENTERRHRTTEKCTNLNTSKMRMCVSIEMESNFIWGVKKRAPKRNNKWPTNRIKCCSHLKFATGYGLCRIFAFWARRF